MMLTRLDQFGLQNSHGYTAGRAVEVGDMVAYHGGGGSGGGWHVSYIAPEQSYDLRQTPEQKMRDDIYARRNAYYKALMHRQGELP